MAISDPAYVNRSPNADFVIHVACDFDPSKALETCFAAQHADRIWHDVVFRRTWVHPLVAGFGGAFHITDLGAFVHGAVPRHSGVAYAMVCSLCVFLWCTDGFGHLG